MSTVLTRDQIFEADDVQVEFVLVPEWSGGNPEAGVYVKGLSGIERDSFEMAMIDQKRDRKGRATQELNLRNLRAKLVVRTAIDGPDPKTANHIFNVGDIDRLGTKSAAALQRVYAVAQRLSGLSNEDVEELTEGLGEDQSGDSGSDSPSPSDTLLYALPSDTSIATSSASGSPSTDSSPSGTGV